jgi:Holliday junction resolvasome RuvABC ATP-dependent DNA helicase subunit
MLFCPENGLRKWLSQLLKKHGRLYINVHLFDKPSTTYFEKIQNYDDVKQIVKRALNSEDSYNMIFIGSPSSGKTLFLEGIMEIRKDAVYFDCTNTTSKILDILQEERPKIICLDELEKMPRQFQEKLLNLLESGRIDVEQQKKQYHFEIKRLKVFGTCNDVSRLSKPLASRFRKIFLPKYSLNEFLSICEKVIPKLSPPISRYIGTRVYERDGSIRDCLSIGKLIQKNDGPEEISNIMSTLDRYSEDDKK